MSPLLLILPYLVTGGIIVGLIILSNRASLRLNKVMISFGVYTGLLLAAVFLYYGWVLPNSVAIPHEVYSEEYPGQRNSEEILPRENLFNRLTNNGINKMEEIQTIEEKTLDYSGDHLHINSRNQHRTPPAAIKKSKEIADTIKIYVLSEAPPFNEALKVEISGHQMFIEYYRIKMLHFAQDFTTAQFTAKGVHATEHDYFRGKADRLIYLEVPADLDVSWQEDGWIIKETENGLL